MLHDDNNLDKSLSEALTDASMLYLQEELENSREDEIFVRMLKKRKRKKMLSRCTRTITVVVLVLFTGVSISIWSQADGVYGGKRFIRKCVNVISPISIEEEISDTGEITVVTTVTDEEDIKKAKDVFDKLKIAGYIPKGYTFDKLTIRADEIITSVEYIYSKGDYVLVISFEYGAEDADIMVVGEEYVSPDTGQTMYVEENRDTNEYSVIEICETYNCIIMGRGTGEEGIKIIESIKEVAD